MDVPLSAPRAAHMSASFAWNHTELTSVLATRAIFTSATSSKHVSINGHSFNASKGSLVTATHLAENSPVVSWGEQDQVPISTWTTFERFVRPGIARQGGQARVVEAPVSGVLLRVQSGRQHRVHLFAYVRVSTRRQDAKRYRRGSALRIKNFGSNPGEVLKAKSEFVDDKFAKFAVEPMRSSLKKNEGTQCGGPSDHSGTLTALGVTVEKGWIQVCRCIFQRGSDALDLESKEGERARERGISPPQ